MSGVVTDECHNQGKTNFYGGCGSYAINLDCHYNTASKISFSAIPLPNNDIAEALHMPKIPNSQMKPTREQLIDYIEALEGVNAQLTVPYADALNSWRTCLLKFQVIRIGKRCSIN